MCCIKTFSTNNFLSNYIFWADEFCDYCVLKLTRYDGGCMNWFNDDWNPIDYVSDHCNNLCPNLLSSSFDTCGFSGKNLLYKSGNSKMRSGQRGRGVFSLFCFFLDSTSFFEKISPKQSEWVKIAYFFSPDDGKKSFFFYKLKTQLFCTNAILDISRRFPTTHKGFVTNSLTTLYSNCVAKITCMSENQIYR